MTQEVQEMLEKGPVSQPSFSSTKEGLKAATSDQYEGAEQIHTLKIFKDRRVLSIKGNFGITGLSKQVGTQRCLFLSSIEQTLNEICTF